jgi:hypothetical protein
MLITEDLGKTPDVTAGDVDRILPTDPVGKFAVLPASDSAFIQAGNDGQPTPECNAFLKKTKSDP